MEKLLKNLLARKEKFNPSEVQYSFKLEVLSIFILGDHLVALNKSGHVYAMGDDTYGQCGQADTTRNTNPPFTETRIKFPTKVVNYNIK